MFTTSLLKRSLILTALSLGAMSGLRAQTSILVNTTGIQLNSQSGNATPAGQAITITSSGGAFGFQVSTSVNTPAGGNWLSVDRTNGTTPSAVLVSANSSTLACPPGGQPHTR